MARNAGLRDTFEDGKTVKTILEKQNYLCPYTKEKLIPGVNCSLDHILPRSRYPKLVTDLTNLEWTTILVNKSKYNMTKKEYLSLIEIIHTNFDGQYLTPITID
jgi:5-methylcytosine-specific restriction endonuclease McrA